MKRLLVILLLLPSIALAVTDETQYVSVGCANNGDGTAASCAASGGAAGAYNSFSNWEGQNRDLVSQDKNLTVVFNGTCEAGGKTLDGWTMDATRALAITGMCLNDVYGRSFTNNESFVTFRGITIKKIVAGSKNAELFLNTGGTVLVEQSTFLHENITRESGENCVKIVGQSVFRNNFIIGCKYHGLETNAKTNVSAKIYNNTIVGATGNGLVVSLDSGSDTSTIELKNNLVTGSTTADYSINVGSATYATATNISSDATSPQTGLRSKTITYVGGGDYHLDAGETDAIDAGTDLTASGFTNDFDGDERGTWDIGADEIEEAPPTTTTSSTTTTTTTAPAGINLLLLHAEGY